MPGDADSPPSEATPLLSSPSSSSPPASSPDRVRNIASAFTIMLLLGIAAQVAIAPQTQLLSDIICADYYSQRQHNGTFPSRDCYAPAVQSEMAFIIGWEAAIENIPNMLLAVPFGALAQRYGRKRILLLALFGSFMNDTWMRLVYWFPGFFPVRAVLLSGVWQSIGASAATISSIAHALVADACTPAQRTSAFSQIRSAKLLSQLLFVPLGGMLATTYTPWLPMFLGTGAFLCAVLAAILLVPADDLSKPVSEASQPKPTTTTLRAKIASLSEWAADNARLIPMILSFFVFQLGEQAGLTLLMQIAGQRLRWSLSKASILISVRAGVNLAALIAVVPAISLLLARKTSLPLILREKRIAQGSGLLLVAGCGVVFLAMDPAMLIFGLVLVSLGDVFSVPVRSLATALVDPQHLGLLYTVIEVMTQAGLFIGQPMLAASFSWGLKLGGVWIGMPFLLAAGFFLMALIAISTVPTTRKGTPEEQEPLMPED